jgi:hypothetical protein
MPRPSNQNDQTTSHETARRTAAAFAEEFGHLGYKRSEILQLFRTPFYTAVHNTWRLLGEEEIACIVERAAEERA